MKITELKEMPKTAIMVHDILDDGTLKTTVPGSISDPVVHSTAEKILLAFQADLNSGKGKNSRTRLNPGHTHTHGGHTHTH